MQPVYREIVRGHIPSPDRHAQAANLQHHQDIAAFREPPAPVYEHIRVPVNLNKIIRKRIRHLQPALRKICIPDSMNDAPRIYLMNRKGLNTVRKKMIAAGLLAGMAILVQHAETVSAVLAQRIGCCLETLIPSLFGCMLLADLLCRCGCLTAGRIMRRIAQRLHLPPPVCGIFTVSQIAGYPVGAVLLRQEAERGQISHETARRYAAVCFGGGPAFLVGLAGAKLFGSAAAGWLMLAAAVCSNFLMLVMLPKPPCTAQTPAHPPETVLNAAVLTQSVSRTLRSLAGICGAVLLFGILLTAMDLLHVFDLLSRILHIPVQTLRPVLTAAADITQLAGIFRIGLPFRVLLPLAAGLLSFGGCCAQLQTCALGVSGLRMGRLMALRLCAAILTALLTALFAPLIPLPDAAAVFAPAAAVSRSGSVLPGLMILCTGLFTACSGRQYRISFSRSKSQ